MFRYKASARSTGVSINHPYTAVQTVLDERSVPIGNAIMQFTFSLWGALSLCIAQTIFSNSLASHVADNVPDVAVDRVVAAGAYGLPGLAGNSPELLHLLKSAYRGAIRDVFIFVSAAGGFALLFSLGFEHRNIKRVADQRDRTRSSDDSGMQKEADE